MSVLISKDEVREPLFALVPVSNPWRWKSRYKHTDRAIKHFIDAGFIVYLVEVAFNRREFVYADAGIEEAPVNCRILRGDPKYKHKYIPLRSRSELWLKENQIRIGVQHVADTCYDWEQICWPDSDVLFLRPNVVGECIQKLQHYDWLQMFSHAQDLNPDYEMLPEGYPHAVGKGFVHHYSTLHFPVKGEMTQTFADTGVVSIKVDLESTKPVYPPPRVFPGLAWACTRYGWDSTGGLPDFHIWGGADWVTAHSLIGKTEGMLRNDLHPNYKALVMEWHDICEKFIRRNVGVMTGTIVHNWHGIKEQRGYNIKHALLAKAKFDPMRHLKRDSQGLWQLNDDGSEAFIQIRDGMRKVAAAREEDSEDMRMDVFLPQGH
jgi:hypothetical protein